MKPLKSLPFFFAMAGCKRHCVYCDQTRITGETSAPTPEEIRQVLRQQTGPVGIGYFGGSFTCLPAERVDSFLEATRAAPAGSSLRFSTHPLCLSPEILGRLKDATRKGCPIACVELGISSLDDAVLESCGRGYSGEQALQAVERLANEGLPVGVQLMIGLPGQNFDSTLDDLQRLARVKGPRSMDLRLYPCLVLQGTPLESLWKSGRYTPLDTETAARWAGHLLLEALGLGFNILRVGLAETTALSSSVIAGPHHPAFGELAWGECLARLLTRNSAEGPWIEHPNRRSLFKGHGKRGLERLAELSGRTVAEAAGHLSFWPCVKTSRGKSRG
ncbi:MAG: radical SAM protein [Synergistales bacterium]